jgi:hypothetical protein
MISAPFLPALEFSLQLLPTGPRESENRTQQLFSDGPPLRSNGALPLRPGEQPTLSFLVYSQLVAADLLDPSSDAITVQGSRTSNVFRTIPANVPCCISVLSFIVLPLGFQQGV